MDITVLRSLATVFAFVAFVGICIWAYSSKRKERFSEAAQLPFADEDIQPSASKRSDNKHQDNAPLTNDSAEVSAKQKSNEDS